MGGSDPSVQLPEFEEFRKIPRLQREMVVTEKIDGTNAVVCVLPDDRVIAGSRTKWITPEDDNKGFARWVRDHEEELRKGLGYGTHYGEWWGSGIGRGYGLKEKRFSLFNTTRWTVETKPACCHVVPELFRGPFDTAQAESCLEDLYREGSKVVPGFMKPEGIVVYHVASDAFFKKTLDDNDRSKFRVKGE